MILKDQNLKNKNTLVLGCGGSARAVVMGLKTLNVNKITIIGRNQNSLELFIKDMKELCDKTLSYHLKLGEFINNQKINFVFGIGSEIKNTINTIQETHKYFTF